MLKTVVCGTFGTNPKTCLLMKLKKLFKNIKDVKFRSPKDPEITGICAHSKFTAPGNLFIAKKGMVDDGSDFIYEAQAAGAVAVLTDMFDPSLRDIVQIIHPHPEKIEAELASTYYMFPSEELFAIGITGTNGKTTTSFLCRYLLQNLIASKESHQIGLIGTIEYILGKQRYRAMRTTPDVVSNHKMLREMCKQGCKAVVMEVTSHALDQARVKNIAFDVAIFTNLTLDHLDYHETMDAYAAAKNRLFTSLEVGGSEKLKKRPPCAVVNTDSPWTKKILQNCPAQVMTYSICDNQADLVAENVQLTLYGTSFDLRYQGKVFAVETPLIGRFNVYNILASIGACLHYGASIKAILALLKNCPSVPGRLELVPNNRDLKIYVDFAHSPDSLENVLECLCELKKGKVFTVFGCGGDRDKTKRPQMAAIAEKYSDFTFVTSDNPRSEDPNSICQEIAKGFQNKEAFAIFPDRKEAITRAIEGASPEDIVLIAGKGHETGQIFGHKTIEFVDAKAAQEACAALEPCR